MRPCSRRAFASLLLAAICASTSAVCAAAGPPPRTLTVVTEFDGRPSGSSIAEMKREVARIYRETGIQVAFRTRDQADGGVFSGLVLLRFRGRCAMDRTPPPPFGSKTIASSGTVYTVRFLHGAPRTGRNVTQAKIRPEC